MLKKIGALLLAAGLVLPYTAGMRVVTSVWRDASEILFQGVPVLIAVAYVLHSLVPPLARFHERHGQGLHGLFRVVFFSEVGAYVALALAARREGWPAVAHVLVALVVTGGLLYWEQGRGTKAERLPLLLLICVGVPTLAFFIETARAAALLYGGWVFTIGYLAAVAGEVLELRAAPKIAHGG